LCRVTRTRSERNGRCIRACLPQRQISISICPRNRMRNRKHMRENSGSSFCISDFCRPLVRVACAVAIFRSPQEYEFLNLVISSHVVDNWLDASWYRWRLHSTLDHSRILVHLTVTKASRNVRRRSKQAAYTRWRKSQRSSPPTSFRLVQFAHRPHRRKVCILL
jgi:hypothetical protein